jgi:SAM-dependent methyltransferase
MNLSEKYDAFYREGDKGVQEIRINRWPRNRWEAACYCAGSGDIVVDIGCGNGMILFGLRDHYKFLWGVELSPKRAADASRNLHGTNHRIVVGNVENGIQEIPTASVDAVICSDVIEHCVDAFAAIEEMHRMLKRDGRLVLNTPNFAKIKNRFRLLGGRFPSTSAPNEGFGEDGRPLMIDGGHLHYFTYRMLDNLCAATGFNEVRHFGFGRLGRIADIYPELLSNSCQIIARKV